MITIAIVLLIGQIAPPATMPPASVTELRFTAPMRGDLDINWYTVDGGGDMWTTGGDLELSGTIGQPDVHVLSLTGGSLVLNGGFWAVSVVDPLLPGDCDGDGDVDLDDFDAFAGCMAGPGAGVEPGCECSDLDGDDDADLADFAVFQANFTGD